MNKQWIRVQLGEVMALSDTATPVNQLNEVRLAGVYSFGRGLFKRGIIDPTETTYRTYNRLEVDDFVISQPKAWEGALARITQEFDGWFLSPVFPTFRANKQLLDPSFLDWYCRRPSVWSELQRNSRGMGARRETVSATKFLSLKIPLPPVEEQRRIVTRIEHLAHKIEEARYLRDRASKERNVLIISVHQNLAGKRVKKLGEILTLEEHAEPVLPTGAYPQVGIRSFGLGLFPKPAVEGTKTTYRAFNRVYTGALILSQVKGWEGAVAVCPPELAGWFASPEYRTFRCIPTEARPGYLAPIVRTEWFWRRLASATRGVGARRERTRPEQFLEIEVPMPDVKQQEKGEALFLQLERIQSLQTEADLGLGGILASVLERAFQGEL